MMPQKFYKQAGFSLIELLTAILIISILLMFAVPYYEQAVESARLTEAKVFYHRFKPFSVGRNLESTRNRLLEKINQSGQLKHFTVDFTCEQEATHGTTSTCWELSLTPVHPNQPVRYYLTTQNNMQQLYCVPINNQGQSFCRAQAVTDSDEAILGQQIPAYLLTE